MRPSSPGHMGMSRSILSGLARHTGAAGRLLCATGTGLIVLVLAWNTLDPGAGQVFGARKLLACFAGTATLAFGILLSRGHLAHHGAAIRWAAALYIAACSFTLSMLWPTAMPSVVLLGY